MIKARYQALNDREKLTLVGGSLLALLLLVYLLVWRPLVQANQQLAAQVDDRRSLVVWMSRAAGEVKQLQQSGAGRNQNSGPVQQSVTNQAARLGIKLERMQSRSDAEAQLWLENTDFNQLLRLIDQLNRDAVGLTKASLRAASTPGQVNAQLTVGR